MIRIGRNHNLVAINTSAFGTEPIELGIGEIQRGFLLLLLAIIFGVATVVVVVIGPVGGFDAQIFDISRGIDYDTRRDL